MSFAITIAFNYLVTCSDVLDLSIWGLDGFRCVLGLDVFSDSIVIFETTVLVHPFQS